MKVKNKKTGKFEHVSDIGAWKQKFFKDNGSVEDQIIQQAEEPTVYKNKIKNWIKDNPKP